jgi:hypothetical protein
MNEFDLQSRFPEMQPVHSAPSLYLMNGIGTTVYGRRDYDDETGTYVKTLCFCVLFLPILALRAYRVADYNRGWAFLGRVPLSGLARLWNLLVLVGVPCAVGGIVAVSYFNSAGYAARQRLAEADRLADEGQLEKAARAYRALIVEHSPQEVSARAHLWDLVNRRLEAAPAGEAAGALAVAVELRKQSGAPADLFDRGLKLATKHTEPDPRGALRLLDAVAPAAEDPKADLGVRRPLLERLVKAEPGSADFAGKLAEVYEMVGEKAKCEAVLLPHKGRLGDGEGARILGQIYAQQGKLDEAHALLMPYAEARLDKLHAAENELQRAQKLVDDRNVELLKSGKAPDFDYHTY